jgi:ferric-dicitrate binding protein FerR (iron transport regulator)
MIRMMRLLALALVVNALLGAPVLSAAEWQVARVTGLVWIVAAGTEPAQATAGMVLPDNATIATTSRARAMLRHGEDILNLGPSTHIAPQARRVRGLTTVLMRQGEVVADIERRGSPHFSVQTPYLAAVVKGTRFTVSVTEGGAEVSVSSGRVEVADLGAGQAVELTNGQRAAAAAGGGLQVSGAGAIPEVQSVSPRSALVETPSGRSANNVVGRSHNTAAANSNAGGVAADTRARRH